MAAFVQSDQYRLFSSPSVADAVGLGRFGLSESVFGTPPHISTLRVVRPIQGESAAALRHFVDALVEAGHHVSLSGLPNLPECIVIDPVSPDSPSTPSWSSCNTPLGEKDIAVVVDSACAEAVLRGSDVFAPGFLASSCDFDADQPVVLFAPRSGGDGQRGSILKGSFMTRQAIAEQCIRITPLQGATTVMSRCDILAGQKGIALKTNPRGSFGHPALGVLPAPLQHVLFLQNHSSMVPAALLNPQPFHRVLDMCAAPGGKASHLLSCARVAGRRELLSGANSIASSDDVAWLDAEGLERLGFRLVCCERSATRAKKLRDTLVQHHTEQVVQRCVDIFARDVNKLSDTLGFDRILLDPPCTGLGLRPRLRPHEHTLEEVMMSADYQRKLLMTAATLLRPGGLLTYSTCTLSVFENEGNIRWAIDNVSDLRLDVTQSVAEASMRDMVAHVHRDIGVHAGLQNPDSVVCWTFLPTSTASPVPPRPDSVGFFVARFTKVAPPPQPEELHP